MSRRNSREVRNTPLTTLRRWRHAIIERQLDRRGSAQVLMFLDRAERPTSQEIKKEMGRHFSLHPGSMLEALTHAYKKPGVRRPQAYRYYPKLGAILGTVDHSGYTRLRQQLGKGLLDSIHAAADLEPISPVDGGTIDVLEDSHTWGLKMIGVEELWNQNITGSGVVVAHLDTGLDGSHETLRDAVVNFVYYDELGHGTLPEYPYFDTASTDNGAYGHGTHTAAIIAGRPIDGRHIGVAPGAQLASAVVIEGGDVMQRVMNGMEWAIMQGAHVLSMSLGFEGWDLTMMPLIENLRVHDVLPVVAIGNYQAGGSCSPGSYTQSLSVGACDRTAEIAGFSSSDVFDRDEEPVVPDLVAPGVRIISARRGGGYKWMSGTSMAAPHVAGLAALLRQAFPAASVAEIESSIFASCGPISGGFETRSARGVPHGPTALAWLRLNLPS